MSDTTFVQEGVLVDYTPTAAKSAGEIVFLKTIAGQVVTDLDADQKGSLRTEGVVRFTKEADTDVYADGDDVKWNATNKTADPAGTDGTLGKAVNGGSASGETTVDVKLNA